MAPIKAKARALWAEARDLPNVSADGLDGSDPTLSRTEIQDHWQHAGDVVLRIIDRLAMAAT